MVEKSRPFYFKEEKTQKQISCNTKIYGPRRMAICGSDVLIRFFENIVFIAYHSSFLFTLSEMVILFESFSIHWKKPACLQIRNNLEVQKSSWKKGSVTNCTSSSEVTVPLSRAIESQSSSSSF